MRRPGPHSGSGWRVLALAALGAAVSLLPPYLAVASGRAVWLAVIAALSPVLAVAGDAGEDARLAWRAVRVCAPVWVVPWAFACFATYTGDESLGEVFLVVAPAGAALLSVLSLLLAMASVSGTPQRPSLLRTLRIATAAMLFVQSVAGLIFLGVDRVAPAVPLY